MTCSGSVFQMITTYYLQLALQLLLLLCVFFAVASAANEDLQIETQSRRQRTIHNVTDVFQVERIVNERQVLVHCI